MLMDEIFENMVGTLKDARRVAKTASPLPLSTAQFDLLNNENADIDVSLSKTSFKRNVVATDYDGQDKAILKEKGRAIEVGDIVEQAHPETAVVAENYKGSGEVENQNEQHAKIVDSINRMPTGFNFNTFASAIKDLVKIAEQLDDEGDLRASVRVMQGVVRLSNLKKKQLDKLSALSPEDLAAWRQKAIESGNIVDDVTDSQSTSATQSTTPPASAKPKTPSHPVSNRKQLGPGSRTIPDPIDLTNIPQLSVVPYKGITPKLNPGAPNVLEADEIIGGNRTRTSPRAQLHGQTIDADTARTEVMHGPKKPYSTTSVTSKPTAPGVMHGPKKPAIITSLVRRLKGRGGRVGLILAALVGAGTLIGILSNSDDDETTSALKGLTKSDNPDLAGLSDEFQRFFSQAVSYAEAGEAEATLEALASSEEKIGQMAELASTPEEQAHVESLHKVISLMGSRLNAEVQKAAADTMQTVSDERNRIRGLQAFFKEHYDPAMPVTGVYNSRLKDAVHKFVHSVKDDLSIAPRMFTVENILSNGTETKLEAIRDIWEKPHMHVEKAQLEQ